MDPARDESLIFELLDLKHEVGDNGSATWFLQDLANEQDAEGSVVIGFWLFSFLNAHLVKLLVYESNFPCLCL